MTTDHTTTKRVPIHLLKEGDVIAQNGRTVTSVEWTNYNDGFWIVGTDNGDFRFDDDVMVTIEATETIPCLWGETNEYVDCVPVAGPMVGGHRFCEVHAECVEDMDDDLSEYQIQVLLDTIESDRYRV